MKENKCCKHEELENINNKLYICQNCSILGIIKEITPIEIKMQLLSKPNNYNIKNEINIFDLTKNSINYYISNEQYNVKQKKNDIFIKNFELYIKFRKRLIKHLYNLCAGINSTYECYYLSILLMDKSIYKLNYIINNYQLDLISTICFIISKKFIEKDILKTEKYNDYLTICHSPQKFINSKDLINSEVECLKILEYNLNIPSPLTILKYIYICGFFVENELHENEIKNIYEKCFDVLSFCVEENEIYLNFNSVQIAFGIIYLIRKKNNLKNNIFKYILDLFNIQFNYIKECVKLIVKLYYKDDKNQINNINKLNFYNNKNSKIYNNYYNLQIKTNEKNCKKYFSQKRKIPKNNYFSPIIKRKKVYTPIINNLEFGSANRLSGLNLDDIDKKYDENNYKSILIVKKENIKAKSINRKHQFFRSSKHRRKDNIIDIKNSCPSPNYFSTIDINVNIEKEKNNNFNI